MKTAMLSLAVLALSGAAVVEAYGPAAGPLTAKIPFEFHVGNQRLPAGTYMVRQVTSAVLQIRGMDTTASASMTYFPDYKDSANGKGGLAFRCYGEKCFFAAAWTGSGSSMSLIRTRTERETATGAVKAAKVSRTVLAD